MLWLRWCCCQPPALGTRHIFPTGCFTLRVKRHRVVLIDKGQLAGPSATGPTGPETSAPAFLFSHQAPYRCKGWTLIQPLTRYGHQDAKIQRGEATIGYDYYRTKYLRMRGQVLLF